MTVLIVDDEPAIRRSMHGILADCRVLEAATGRAAIDRMRIDHPGLVILDLGLPDLSGVEVCVAIRAWSSVPILVLSARHGEDEKVRLLDAGADDYLTKPFSASELQARVRALRRRFSTTQPSEGVIAIGSLRLDIEARRLERDGDLIPLTPIEWELLVTLMRNAGRTMSHRRLFAEVWHGRNFGDAPQYLRVYVAHLRRKIEQDSVRPHYLFTVPGVGYRFATPAEAAAD